MAERRYKRKNYNRLSILLTKQPWLLNKQDELDELLEINGSDDEQDILIDLLDDYIVIDEDLMDSFLHDMADYIKGILTSAKHVIICAFTRGRDPDSGQVVIQLLKPLLADDEFENYSLINSLDDLNKEIKDYPQTDHIVLVDETVGSGKTLGNQLTYIRGLERSKVLPINVCVIAAIKTCFLKVLGDYSGVGYFCPLLLKKGISERYCEEELNKAESTMHRIETRLANQIGKHCLSDYSFGYGDAQMLYSHVKWNCPNSMFPVFWWPKDRNGKKRHTLFTRSL